MNLAPPTHPDPDRGASAQILVADMGRTGARFALARILSGPGLLHLHEMLCAIEGRAPQRHGTAALSADAADSPVVARRAVSMFCDVFGAVAGDFALACGARGGVQLAGGLTLALAAVLRDGGFRRRFEGKGRLAHMLQTIPPHLIGRPDAVLLGCADLGRDLVPAGMS